MSSVYIFKLMKRRFCYVALTVLMHLTFIVGCSSGTSQQEYDEKAVAQRDTLFQISTINALLEGAYDEVTSINTLKQHGDFGIGTFTGLEGEMVEFNNNFYQIKADGIAYNVNDSTGTPFAAVTFMLSRLKAYSAT